MTSPRDIGTTRVQFGSLGVAVGIVLGAVGGTVVLPAVIAVSGPTTTPIGYYARSCNIGYRALATVPDDGTRIAFDQDPRTADRSTHDILCLLESLGAPTDIISEAGQVDSSGEQNAAWPHYAIAWTRSSTDGFGATIVTTRPDSKWRSPEELH